MKEWMDVISAIFALLAAIFWFLSAYGKLPPMVAYWDETPDHDPFYKAVKYSARMNRFAAGFSGLSALSVFLKFLMS